MTPFHNPDFPDHLVDDVARGASTKNVIDHYKSWTEADIRADLARTAWPITVVAENLAHDFNIGTVVRNANAFNAERVIIAGRRQFDKRGTVGLHHYTNVERVGDLEALYAGLKADGYRLVCLDNVDGSTPLAGFAWPQAPARTALILGQEQIGVSNVALGYADAVVRIEQYGAARSLNVGTASGIALYAYTAAQ